jgi:hypothetical protein
MIAALSLAPGCAHRKPPPPATFPANVNDPMTMTPQQMDDVIIDMLAHFDFGGIHLAELSDEEFEALLGDESAVAEKLGVKAGASRALTLMRAARQRALEELSTGPATTRESRSATTNVTR